MRVVVPSQAGGGAEIVAKSVADGYTLMFTTSALAVREAVYIKLPFIILRDFQPVSQSVTQSIAVE